MGQEQGLSIAVGGGLDKTSPSFELFKTPGAATRLLNFESSIYGGYRRVNGYRKFVRSGVTSVTINEGGAGYSADTEIVFTDNELQGSGASATLTIDGNGTITAVTIDDGGSGYSIPPTVVLTNIGTGVTTEADLTAVISDPEQPSGTDDPLQGIHAFEDGGIAFQAGNIYWSTDGVDWIQLNKDYGTCSHGSHDNQYDCEIANGTWTPAYATGAQLAASGVEVPLDDTARYMTTEFTPSATDTTRIIATNGIDPPTYLETYKDGGTRYFKFFRGLYNTFGVTSTADRYDLIPQPKYCTTHEDHLVLGGWDAQPGTFYYSALYDDTDFTDASAGEIAITDTVTGIKPFRKDLVIFGRNSIAKLVDINGTPTMQDVTKNIGCLDGYTIQEIGGDLVFLAPDGIRTVAATTRIDDIELSSISSKIQPIILDIIKNISSYNLVSSVIRSKNQYRLFYTQSGTGAAAQRGITGTFKIGPNGTPVWEWSELIGFNVACVTSNYGEDNVERQYHGSYNGYVHQHDIGNSFDGDNVRAEFKTPDIDYGDIGIRKTLHFLKLSLRPEGLSDVKIDVSFDFDDSNVPKLQLGTVTIPPSLFGVSTFGTTVFGGATIPAKKLNLWGSGFSNNFKFYSNDTNPPYSIQGMYVDLIPASRR
jgi:hypothetical protein